MIDLMTRLKIHNMAEGGAQQATIAEKCQVGLRSVERILASVVTMNGLFDGPGKYSNFINLAVRPLAGIGSPSPGPRGFRSGACGGRASPWAMLAHTRASASGWKLGGGRARCASVARPVPRR